MIRFLIYFSIFLGLFFVQPLFAKPSVKRIFVVVLENTDYKDALKQPFQAELARKGAVLTNFYALSRPSQPNYISLVAGNAFGVKSNDNVVLNQRHLGDLLEEKGKSWKSYAEDYPGNCFQGLNEGVYWRKHEPFLSFANILENKERCNARVVNASELEKDFIAGKLSDFSLFIPNNLSNGHDTGFVHADTWLQKRFEPLLRDARFMKDMLFVVTYDEGSPKGQHILTLLYGNGIRPGARSDQKLTHFSLLKTFEELLSVGSLHQEDERAASIEGVWTER
jgi:hypothetical protein